MKRAVITGMGVICGNASDKEEFRRACTDGISGIRKCTAFSAEGLMTEYFGENTKIKGDNRLYELIRISAAEMLDDAGIDSGYISSLGTNCRMFFGTLLSTADHYYKHSKAKADGKSDNFLASMNDYASYAKELFGVKGAISVSSAACASGTTAVGMAFDHIRNGICDLAVAGGADPLMIIAAYGFNALRSLSSGICDPYDESRDGINIGECGAFFTVESLEHALERNAKIYCEIIGYGLGNDAYHITSPDPSGSGAYMTMLSAVKDGGIFPEQIDYINGHGTGTPINDSMEVKAIDLLYENSDKKPAFSSTKALIGHCMGSSGAIELASVILSMNSGKYIPMPNLKNPINGEKSLSSETYGINIDHALSNSFAFAGNSASLLIKKYTGGG